MFIEFVMSTYILLWNWTDQGIRNAKGAPNRYESFKAELQKAGGKSINAYYTFGEYDGVGRRQDLVGPDDLNLVEQKMPEVPIAVAADDRARSGDIVLPKPQHIAEPDQVGRAFANAPGGGCQ